MCLALWVTSCFCDDNTWKKKVYSLLDYCKMALISPRKKVLEGSFVLYVDIQR